MRETNLNKLADRNSFLNNSRAEVGYTFWQVTLHPEISLARNPLPRFPSCLSAHCVQALSGCETPSPFLCKVFLTLLGPSGAERECWSWAESIIRGMKFETSIRWLGACFPFFFFFGGCSQSRTWAWMRDWGSSGSWERHSECLVTVPVRTASWSGLVRTARPTATWMKLLMWEVRITTLGKHAWDACLLFWGFTFRCYLKIFLFGHFYMYKYI